MEVTDNSRLRSEDSQIGWKSENIQEEHKLRNRVSVASPSSQERRFAMGQRKAPNWGCLGSTSLLENERKGEEFPDFPQMVGQPRRHGWSTLATAATEARDPNAE